MWEIATVGNYLLNCFWTGLTHVDTWFILFPIYSNCRTVVLFSLCFLMISEDNHSTAISHALPRLYSTLSKIAGIFPLLCFSNTTWAIIFRW